MITIQWTIHTNSNFWFTDTIDQHCQTCMRDGHRNEVQCLFFARKDDCLLPAPANRAARFDTCRQICWTIAQSSKVGFRIPMSSKTRRVLENLMPERSDEIGWSKRAEVYLRPFRPWKRISCRNHLDCTKVSCNLHRYPDGQGTVVPVAADPRWSDERFRPCTCQRSSFQN